MRFQFQADAFNAFNRANWNNPNVANAGSPLLGRLRVPCRRAFFSSAASSTSEPLLIDAAGENSAIYDENGARGVAGRVGGEVDGRSCELFDLAEALHGCAH